MGPGGRLQLATATAGTGKINSEGVHLHTIASSVAGSAPLNEPQSMVMNKTGKYIIIISNCGRLANATITGRVAVQNSFGYLPAYEYGTLHFYGWLALVHTMLNFLWLSLQIKELKHLLPVQRGLTLISMTAMLEVVFTYASLKYTNVTGTRQGALTMSFLLCDTLKYIFGGWLILYLAGGMGVSADEEEETESMPFTSLLVAMLVA